MQGSTKATLKAKPLIKPDVLPGEIMHRHMSIDELSVMAGHLASYRKSGKDWDEYRKKIDSKLLRKWAMVLNECNDNGFFNPKPDGDEISWAQMVERLHVSDRARAVMSKPANKIPPMTSKQMREDRLWGEKQ
jgi:hypothetical protein